MPQKSTHFHLTQRQQLDIIEGELRNERDQFRSQWRDLSEYILPRRSRFFVSDAKKGDRRNLKIIDPTATLAVRTFSAGMMTGITSPARPWFRLGTDREEFKDNAAVNDFLSGIEDKMRRIFLRSNLYNILPTLYGDLATFGTAAIYMEEDMDNVVNFTSFPVGSYMVSNDKKGRVRVFIREFQMSVRQIVEKFGTPNPEKPMEIDWENISTAVKDRWAAAEFEAMVDVRHVVMPNDDYDPSKIESKFKKFKSCYYEMGFSANNQNISSHVSSEPDKFLRVKGYDYYPIMVVRWEVAGEDTYGTNAPGQVVIGDVKQLQLGEKRIAGALDQKVRPSMVGPTSLKNVRASILPGDITYVNEQEGQPGFRRLFQVDFDIRELEVKQEQVRQRIEKGYYVDLFLMLANSNRRQITAREIEERHEEKLLGLGPVLERINQDGLDPIIENTFLIMTKQGLVGDVPEELQQVEYSIEYVSVMAQAQKLAGIGNLERLVGFIGQTAGLDPATIENLDFDEIIKDYAERLGVPPKSVRPQEVLDAIRAQQAAAQAQAQQQANLDASVQAGKTLSETNINEENALGAILQGAS